MMQKSGREIYSLLGGVACLLISLGAFAAVIAGLVSGSILDPKALNPDGSGGYYLLSSSPIGYWLTLCAWFCCAILLAFYGSLLLRSRR